VTAQTSALTDLATPLETPELEPRRRGRARKLPFLGRELSWLEFNARVLYEAKDARNQALLDAMRHDLAASRASR